MEGEWIIVTAKKKSHLVNTRRAKRKVEIEKNVFVDLDKLLALQTGREYVLLEGGTLGYRTKAGDTPELKKVFSTEMARKKYLRRQKDTRENYFTVFAPTPFSLCEHYQSKGWLFSIDTLGRMLRAGSVCSSGKYIVCEDSFLLTGAIAFQTAGEAQILSVQTSVKNPNVFASEGKRTIYATAEESCSVLEKHGRESFDTLFICCSWHLPLEPLLSRFSEHVRFSGSVVVYSTYKEALLELHNKWTDSAAYRDVKLTESFSRRFVHRDGITNPELHKKQYSGYVLSARRMRETDNLPEIAQPGAGAKGGSLERVGAESDDVKAV